MKNTPGPWKYVGRNGLEYIVEKYPDFQREDCLIAKCTKEEYARPIAAVPDLLEALQAIAEMKINEKTDYEQIAALCMAIAKTAIAKAEGK